MKLRTTHNSIRIRIRKSELAILHKEKIVMESIQFPNAIRFQFALKISTTTDVLNAELTDNMIVLWIPEKEAIQWISTNQVGIETKIDLSDGEKLHLLVEKDFPCLDRSEEDKSDTFWELAPETPEPC